MRSAIPVVDGLPIAGSVWPMFNHLPEFLCTQSSKHGPVFRVRAMGREFIALTGIDAVTFVGSTEGKQSLESRPSWIGMIAEYGCERSLVSDDGDTHAQFRAMMHRGYSRQSLDNRYGRIIEVIDTWLDRHWRPGSKVAAVERLQELILDEISIAIADQLLFEDIDYIRTQIHWATNVHLLKRWPTIVLRLPKYQRARALLMADARRIAEMFKARSESGVDNTSTARLFDDLIRANKMNPELLTDHDLPLNLYGPFLAGMDTASNTVGAVLAVLSGHPSWLGQVTQEADELFADGIPDEDALFRKTRYLDGVVRETMRLYPSVPALMRHARTDFEFAGYKITQGAQIIIGTCVPQMSADYFTEPLTFDPTRWTDQNLKIPSGAFSPFGRGHHMCMGKRIAEVLIPLTVARIAHSRSFRLEDPRYTLKNRFAYGVDLAADLCLRPGIGRHPPQRAT
jgi:cytochrome P450